MATRMIACSVDALEHANEWAVRTKSAARRAAEGSARAKSAKEEKDALSISGEVVRAVGRAVVDGAPVDLVEYVCVNLWDDGAVGKDTLYRKSGAGPRMSEARFLAQHAGERLRTAAPYWAEGEEPPKGLAFQTLVKTVREERKAQEAEKAVKSGAALVSALTAGRGKGLTLETVVTLVASTYGVDLAEVVDACDAAQATLDRAAKEKEEEKSE